MSKFYKSLIVLILFSATTIFSQNYYTISGKVTSSENGSSLISANVFVKEVSTGAATDIDGNYKIRLKKGTYTVVCSYIGYKTEEVQVDVTGNVELNFSLQDYQYSLSVTVLADRAKERETPVAFTNIEKKAIETKLASRDIPLVLNSTPSVYATQQGGGAGDARVNIRGFNQRNIGILINGVPINDMENGWVYWSNWDGLGDATSSVQVQRGLSAVNLATPSVGGTMNIVTDPAAQKFGVKAKQEFGNDGFMKTTVMANTGLVDGKWALSVAGVRKLGDGLIDKTWTDAWAYYLGASYNINNNNRLELYAVGSPQRHGQNLYKQNIAVYDQSFAKDLDDYDPKAFNKFKEAGRKFNQNWAPVTNYNKDQYWNGGTGKRHDASFINERENFYHKPQINLNWYSTLSQKFSLYTTAYYSGGVGGGTGGYGKILTKDFNGKIGGKDYKYYYGPSPWTRDWDATIAMNRGPAGTYYVNKKKLTKANGQSLGILRNSINTQWTVGVISKLNFKYSDELKFALGIDARTAEIEHYRTVRDLLGGEYYIDKASKFWPKEGKKRVLGDKINYYNTNKINWIGGYLQGEYSTALFSTYATFGMTMNKYDFTDHFRKGKDGNELNLESDNLVGWQLKGGVSYRITPETQIYVNAGYIDRSPIFDNVIDDYSGSKNPDPDNEKITSIEGGINYVTPNRKLTLKASYYYTMWKDRGVKRSTRNENNEYAIVSISGLDQKHSGIELEAAYQPIDIIRFDMAASFGNWEYTDDVDAKYKDINNGQLISKSYNLYIKDLKVGDSPQTQFVIGTTLFPVTGLSLNLNFRHYAKFYADFDPTTRTKSTDRKQSWKTPAYSLFDMHLNYRLPIELSGIKIALFAHVFNLFDEVYIQDAVDNSKYNAFDKDHDADDAEVFFGLERTFNAGLRLEF